MGENEDHAEFIFTDDDEIIIARKVCGGKRVLL